MDTRTLPAFGELLRRHRAAAGLTQEELAERAGLSVRAVSDLERGVKMRPHRDTVALLAAALNLESAERAVLDAARARPAATRDAAPDAGRTTFLQGSASLPPLIGRVHELTLLERHLTDDGPLVFVLTGEPGIGKSRLLHEAAERAENYGWSVLAGGCQRRIGQEPYAPLLQALERHIHEQPPDRQRESLCGCAWLVRLLPELAGGPIEPLPPWTLSPEQERRLLFRAVARYLANVAGPTGTLLLLDDLQWAGPDACELLATLVRSGEARLRVVGAYRDIEVDAAHSLSSTLADLAHAGLAAQHALGPLAPVDAACLLDSLLDTVDMPDTALRERVLQRTGGVPFFLVSCVQALRTRQPDGAADDVPWTVAQGVRQRLSALPDGAREMLGVAAVIGRQAPRYLLDAVWARPEDDVLAALDAAIRARLLVAEGMDDYRFAHDVIREVVEGDLSVARRAALHRRVAEALESAHTDDLDRISARVASHYEQAGCLVPAVSAYERAALAARRVYAHADAIAYYRRAIGLLEKGGEGLAADWLHGSAARLQESLGDIFEIIGRHDDVGNAFSRALSHLSAHDTVGQARLLRKTAKPLVRQHQFDEALRLFDQAERALGPEPCDDARAWRQAWIDIQFDRRDLHYWRGQWAENAAVSERMRAAVEQDGTPIQRAMFIDDIGLAFGRDRYVISDETLAAARAVLDAWREIGDVSTIAEAQMNLGFSYLWRDVLDEAEEHIGAAFAMAERTGDAWQQACYLAYLTVIARKRERLDEVQRLARRGMSLAAEVGTSQYVGMAHANLAWLAYRRGDHAAVRTHGDAALEAWQSLRAFPFQWTALWPLLAVALDQNDLAGAVDHARAMLEPSQQRLPDVLERAVEEGIAAWDAAQPEPASARLRQALAIAHELAYL